MRTRDYGPRDGSDLELWMRTLLAEQGIAADGEIWLQTFPRVLGYAFNPVSFWHCHDAHGRLRAVLAEVNNTFGETHRYLLRVADNGSATASSMRVAVLPADRALRIPLPHDRRHAAHRPRLPRPRRPADPHHAVRPRRADARPRAGAGLLRYPLLGLGVVFRIHWQALRLWIKGVPFFRKPPRSANHTTVHEEPLR
jgi:DUF1365 family protein